MSFFLQDTTRALENVDAVYGVFLHHMAAHLVVFSIVSIKNVPSLLTFLFTSPVSRKAV